MFVLLEKLIRTHWWNHYNPNVTLPWHVPYAVNLLMFNLFYEWRFCWHVRLRVAVGCWCSWNSLKERLPSVRNGFLFQILLWSEVMWLQVVKCFAGWFLVLFWGNRIGKSALVSLTDCKRIVLCRVIEKTTAQLTHCDRYITEWREEHFPSLLRPILIEPFCSRND